MKGAGGREAGMTLVEMLVVLAIVGITAGAAALSIGSATRAPNIESEARRLADRLQLAADDVMVSDRPLAFIWNEKGYAFVGWSGSGATEGEALDSHSLPAGMTIEPKTSSRPVPLGIDGMGMPVAVRLRSDTESWIVAYDGLNATALRGPAS
jgi:general secretion pathway protein H